MGLTKTIYKYLFSNLLTKIHVFIYLKDIIWGDDSMEEKVKQWYEENPELMEAEKAAMEMLAKDDYKKFLFLKDGRACWYIGFNSKLSGRRYYMVFVYPPCHPSSIEIPGIRVYPINPSYESIVKEMNASTGRQDDFLPYSIRETNGINALVICNPGWCHCQNILASKEGAISAASVLMETKRFVEFYEMGIANHGTGFYRFTSIDLEAQKQACINSFGSPAAAYYEVYKKGGSENKKKRMIKVDKSRKESLTVI